MPASSVILIGTLHTLERLEQQLDFLEKRPQSLGWVIASGADPLDHRILGRVDALREIVNQHRPGAAIICLPAVMTELVRQVRTQLRRLGVEDRFVPTLEDLMDGIGPRTHFDIDPAELLQRPPRHIDETTIRDVIRNRRVLITGAGGSIGSELARIVASHDPEILVLMDRSENALFEIDRQIARRAPALARQTLLHDVVEAEGTLAHCRAAQPEIVFHAAAHKHVPMMEDHPGAAVDNNLFGTRAVADAADEIGVERFVMISTDKAVNPTSVMGATKRLAELYVQFLNQESSTAFSMVRFGNVLGSSGSVLEVWSAQLAEGGPITITDPAMTRYFMTIHEAASLVIQAAGIIKPDSSEGEVLLLDMGEPVKILDLAQQFIRLHGFEPVVADGVNPPRSAPAMPIVFTGMRPGEKIHEDLAFDAECMLKTRHPDINIWRIAPPDPLLIREMLSDLSPEMRDEDPRALAARIHRYAGGYQARSVHEVLQ
jgi:FlaA1/EpsC-like NDP-sugar epimerase